MTGRVPPEIIVAMEHDRLERIRKEWQRWRGRVNWSYDNRHFAMNVPSDDVPNAPIYNLDISAMTAETTRVYITAQDEGWRCADGETYEWWNIIYDGRIIDMEWYVKP